MKYALPQPYEEMDHTADVGVIVRGADERETLARLVLAMSHLLSGGGALEPDSELSLEVSADDLSSVAIDVLRELLFRFDTEHVIVAWCRVDALSPTGARLTLATAPYDEQLHEEGTDLKAVTFHAARFERDDTGWMAQIVFDV